MRLLAGLCLTCNVLACTAYEYEEDVYLSVDGSGTIRVSGSLPLLREMHGASSVASMRARFADPSIEIDSVRETIRDGRRYVHVQGSFADWNTLCRHPAFRDRRCRLSTEDSDELALSSTVPAPARKVPDDVPRDAPLAFRFHFPSTVRFHNSPDDIERGNIVRWERSAAELFGGEDMLVEARFERRSVLATTVAVFGTALALVALTVAIALFWIVRKGRRELAEEAKR